MQARKKGILEINQVNIRDFADNKWRRVDDRPYGGGPGMVLMPEPTVKAIRSVKTAGSRTVYLSPQGSLLTAKKARELSGCPHLILLCGHYEGIDERALAMVDEEISIGDYVLTNGCLAAIVLLDAVVRFLPGVLGHDLAAAEDSFENEGGFDHPHYTRPEVFEGMAVPEVLLSGNHRQIAQWRKAQALAKTKKVRPDLIRDD
jgi:tRNA (guanine37-N1)-methyltransferase